MDPLTTGLFPFLADAGVPNRSFTPAKLLDGLLDFLPEDALALSVLAASTFFEGDGDLKSSGRPVKLSSERAAGGLVFLLGESLPGLAASFGVTPPTFPAGDFETLFFADDFGLGDLPDAFEGEGVFATFGLALLETGLFAGDFLGPLGVWSCGSSPSAIDSPAVAADMRFLIALLLGVPLVGGTPPAERLPLGDAPFLNGVCTGRRLSNCSGLKLGPNETRLERFDGGAALPDDLRFFPELLGGDAPSEGVNKGVTGG